MATTAVQILLKHALTSYWQIVILNASKDYEIGICCFSSKHAALRRKIKDWLARNQNNVSEWGDMSIRGLLFQLLHNVLKFVIIDRWLVIHINVRFCLSFGNPRWPPLQYRSYWDMCWNPIQRSYRQANYQISVIISLISPISVHSILWLIYIYASFSNFKSDWKPHGISW
jgi:hypothetical protein